MLRSAGLNGEIALALIGAGTRGGDLIKDLLKCTGAKLRAACDVYRPHVDKAIRYAADPSIKRYTDYREILADKSIDAVIIAAPDHWHSKMLIDAVEAGKDVYVEKGWTRTVEEAKAMLAAVKRTGRVMQLGHQGRQYASAIQARELIESGYLGPVTMVNTGRCGNSPVETATWRWYGYYNQFTRPDPAQVEKDVDWKLWLGSAPQIPFNMEHFWHWRCYWRYGTGVAGDLLSHEFDFVQSVLRYGIPDTCASLGGINLLQDGREIPDTTNTTYQYEKQNCTLTFLSTMNSGVPAQPPEFRGKYATIRFNAIGQDANDFEIYGDSAARKYDRGIIRRFDAKATQPQPSHMQDFINAVRDRTRTKCNEDEAFVEAVTFIMSVVAYKEKRVVRWDRERQQIV